MLDVEDWAEIRRLHRSERVPIKVIARALGISKNTVRAALRSDGPPKYVRAPRGSVVDAVEPRIRALLQTCPTMPATVIAERIGWTRGMTVLSERVRELRPVFLPPDPASRTGYVAGEIAQHDFWFPDIELPVGFGQTRTGQAAAGVDDGQRLFADTVRPADPDPAPPKTSTAAGGSTCCGWGRCRGCWSGTVRARSVQYGGGRNKLTAECHAFRGTLGAKVLVLRPRDPEAKGIIERAHDYLETSFLPGRSFTGPADFNTQLGDWLERVNRRPRRALGCAPCDRIVADRQQMLGLPPVPPATGWRVSLRLPRDYYVRLDSNDYSVHPSVIGRRIEVVADLDRVRAFCEAGWSPTTSGCGPGIKACPIPTMSPRRKRLRLDRIGRLRPAPEPRG